MRGRTPKPTAIKKLENNPGHRPLPENEPQPERQIPAMPRGMGEEFKNFWKQIALQLDELNVLTALDGPALTIMAVHYANAKVAAKMLAKEGLQAEDENGALRKHPLNQVLRDNSTAFRQWAIQFGLTPASRARLQISEPDQMDELEEFFNND